MLIVALCVDSCKKDIAPPSSVSVTSETLTIGTTTVSYDVKYEYPKILDEIKIHISSEKNMENASVHDAISDKKCKQFSISIENLTYETKYYYYYEFKIGSGFGKSISKDFNTKSCLPTVSTDSITNITPTSAICGGHCTDVCDSEITQRGVCWSTTENPSADQNKNITKDGSGNGKYTSNIIGLTQGTTYYVKAYATNKKGETGYGMQQIVVPRLTIPTVTTDSITNITHNSATCGGNVTNEGASPVKSKGVCWCTSGDPKIYDNTTNDGTDLGKFISKITNLSCTTKYYIRAYATNNEGTGYGNLIEFTTLSTIPSVSTLKVQDITGSTAICTGEVTYEGATSVIERGVCWSENPTPTIFHYLKKEIAGGIGKFTIEITGLSSEKKYYARAYAKNSSGTPYYGDPLEFTTTIVGSWKRLEDIAYNSEYAVGFSIGNYGYVLDNGYNPRLYEYNPFSEKWILKKTMNFNGYLYGAVGFSIGRKGYIITGTIHSGDYSSSYSYSGGCREFWEYEIDYNNMTLLQDDDAFPGEARSYAFGFSIGSKGYIGGGINLSGKRLNDFWEYDPNATPKWKKLEKPLPVGTGVCAVGFSTADKGYVGLGESDGFYQFEPSSGWSYHSNFGDGKRTSAVGFSIGEKLYVGLGKLSNEFYEFDGKSNWVKIASFPGGKRAGAVCFTINNKGYVGTGSGPLKKDFWEFTP